MKNSFVIIKLNSNVTAIYDWKLLYHRAKRGEAYKAVRCLRLMKWNTRNECAI